MLRMLEAQAPAKQTATDTISTLSGRLASATLLEDRRAAILGLRSFAKEYPASVASGSLRGLISCLIKDAEDPDTIKVVLETLMMLFNPDENSPEASDEVALWLADEFAQRQDNITILLDLLETPDFYSRLYSLQLLHAIHSARPERTQECILTAPLGTSRLVAILDDPRDAVSNAGLSLLIGLSRTSTELQKLFVFENAFEKLFHMIQSDGSLRQGGSVVQDCLSLLANLVRLNASNQTTLRETGGVARFALLLPGAKSSKKADIHSGEDDDWVSPTADKNIWGLLAILRMFLVPGTTSTLSNQNAFHHHRLLQQVLNMAFDSSLSFPIRVEALNTCADLIRGNARLQEEFARFQVRPFSHASTTGSTMTTNGTDLVYVIDALIDLTLSPASLELFDARYAACECIKAYFYGHTQLRTHFLKHAIARHIEGSEEARNPLTTLMNGTQGSHSSDPYRIFFAAALMFHLIQDDIDAKNVLMEIAEGDADNGEEVVTCIQTLTSNLITSLRLSEDERITIAYLMLLQGWLFEDAVAVNDFLGEASSLQSLVQEILKPGDDRLIVRGLCSMLLGIIYEFSTKDSPVARRDLQTLLNSKLGREKYLNAIRELRVDPLVRDFEVLPRTSADGSLPEVFFDESFIEFVKDNFSRLSRAIDRDPVIEIHQSHEGIDRDLVDTLRGQLQEKTQAIEKLQAALLTSEQKLNQEHADHRKTQESSSSQLSMIKKINEDLHKTHEAEAEKLRKEHKQATLDSENRQSLQTAALNNKLQQAIKDTSTAVARTKYEYEDKIRELSAARVGLEGQFHASDRARQEALATVQKLELAQQKLKDNAAKLTQQIESLQQRIGEEKAQVQRLTAANTAMEVSFNSTKSELQDLKVKMQDQTWKVKDGEEKLRKIEAAVKEKEQARAGVQTELDDLFVVLGDLEDKRTRDKQRLRELGQDISDDDEEDEEENEDDGDQ